MALSYRDTQFVKAMLIRGDRQHDIAAYFGVNGGRIAEVATGDCDWPNADPMSQDKLPPPGPYVTKFAVNSVVSAIHLPLETIDLAIADGTVEDGRAALELAKQALEEKIAALREA